MRIVELYLSMNIRDSTYCRIASQYDLENTTFPTKR